MFKAFLRNLIGFFGLSSGDTSAKSLQANSEPKRAIAKKAEGELVDASSALVAYDENSLERSRMQLQLGDWDSLTKLDRNTLQHHPDRANLALLAAAGHLQQGNSHEARKFTRLAQDWGCGKKHISQILISGVHNSLGRAAAVSGQAQRALEQFQSSIQAGAASSEVRPLTQTRVNHELTQLGLPLSMLQLKNAKQENQPTPQTTLPNQPTA
jgi:hypothetical protein